MKITEKPKTHFKGKYVGQFSPGTVVWNQAQGLCIVTNNHSLISLSDGADRVLQMVYEVETAELTWEKPC